MPGFTDMHVHMETEYNPHAYVQKYVDDPADVAYDSVKFAEITLMSGFTTVRDLGGSGINISLRDAVNKGKVVGPRIFTAGKSIATWNPALPNVSLNQCIQHLSRVFCNLFERLTQPHRLL